MSETNRVFEKCVYTILHTKTLDEMYQRGTSHELLEKKKWATAYKLFAKAQQQKEKMLVVYARAEEIMELIYYATIKDIQITPEDTTRYFIEGLTPFKEPLPIKTQLIVDSKGQPMDEWFIRPYAICRTPEFLMNIR